MTVRLVLFAALAWMLLGASAAPRQEKTGCFIDPMGCHSGTGADPGDTADRGLAIDPNG
jgi:hypothetical protein